MTKTVVTMGGSPITAIVIKIKDVTITRVIVAIENVHMVNTDITSTTNIMDENTPIRVIGGPGMSGTGTQDSTLIFRNAVDIIEKADI